jgi:hypothetical protein
MEKLHELDLMDGFGSNMPVKGASFHIDFIDDLQTLKRHCKMLNPNPSKKGINRYFFFGSEMGKWLPKDQPWLKSNIEFIEELQTIRKYGLSFAGDAIDRVDGRVLNATHFEGCFIKYNPKDPTVAVYEDWSTGARTFLKNIPRTNITFDTWYSANFYMEPRNPETENIPLNPEHQIVEEYMKHGSWKKAGVDSKKGKRSVMKVLEYHFTHCLRTGQNDVLASSTTKKARDTQEMA